MTRLFFLLGTLLVSSCEAPPTPKNVLFLFTDDQRFNTVHALGNDEIHTPHMDRLVAMGTSFTRAHIMGGLHGAICAPSRAMLMTGRPLFDLLDKGDVIDPAHTMMPVAFREAGYTTFGTGKWHNDRAAYTRAFSNGGNIYFGGMHWPRDGGHERPWLFNFDSTGAYPNTARWQAEGYSSQLYADAVIDFLEQQQEASDPFFAYVSFTSPHDPRTPPAPYDSWYPADSVSLPPNVMPLHPFDNGELGVRDEMLLPHPRDLEDVRNELGLYYGMISEVDAQIGRILEALEATGKLEETLIVFAGDNGLAVGSHGLLGKQNLYEHSIRVPLVMAGPGIPQGEQRDALVYLFDLFPTLAELNGLPVPETVIGQSLRPVLRSHKATVRNTVFYAYRDLQRGVRTADNWKLLSYNIQGRTFYQLFNLDEDPHELQDLASNPSYREQREAMTALLEEQSALYNDRVDLTDAYWGKERPQSINHLAQDKPVALALYLHPDYPGKGPSGLTDGILCTNDFKADCWHAYQRHHLDVVIDLEDAVSVAEVQMRFLRNIGAWIFLPVSFEVALSNDGASYYTVHRERFQSPEGPEPAAIETFTASFEARNARYIRVRAENQGLNPAWHNGAGKRAWLFFDEVVVR